MPPTPRPFSELRDTGLLWLINTSVLHPRGYALALHMDDDGNATGWSLMGDGTEAWTMGDPPDGHPTLDELMARTKELLA